MSETNYVNLHKNKETKKKPFARICNISQIEAATGGVLKEQVFLEILQNS